MNYPKPGKLVGGIIMAAFGLTALCGMGASDESGFAYIVVCLLLMGGGLALILVYVASRKRYSAYQQQQNARKQREQELIDKRKELELQKVNAEIRRLKEESEALRVCPHCGAPAKGEICEYCGSRL